MNEIKEDQVDQLSEQIGEKIRKMVDRTVIKANKFLKLYGIKAKMQIALEPLNEDESKGK